MIQRHLYLFLFPLILVPSAAVADSATEAAERIKDRLAQVDALKESGDVGEDARGFLVMREDLGPRQQSIVDAENADRLVIYKKVAGRTGQTVAEVGEQRAIQIFARARAGVWLQKPGGDWYQKQ